MSTTQIPETTNPTQEMALEALLELVDLLCPTHAHKLSITNPIPSSTVEGYSVVVECSEGDIVWAVQMWANCSFRRIRRSKSITIHNAGSGKAPKNFLRTLKVWEGLVCDDIVKLHRLGKLKKDWWNYPVLLSEEHKDAMYVNSDYYNQGPTNDDPENEIRAIEAGYKAPAMRTISNYPSRRRVPSEWLSTYEQGSENEDSQDAALSKKGSK